MAKGEVFSILSLLLLPLLTPTTGQAYVVSSGELSEDWLAGRGLGKEKGTHLHFYFHDRVGGKNATTVKMAAAPTAGKSPTGFGQLVMADDPLTVSPDPNSDEVGRAQGMYGTAGSEEVTLFMAFSFFFNKGEFNGSSLSMVSRNPITHTRREMAIVGGTGKFRLAKGIASAKTVMLQGLSAIVEYNVEVIHY